MKRGPMKIVKRRVVIAAKIIRVEAYRNTAGIFTAE